MKKGIVFLIIGWILLYLVFFKILPYLSDKYHGCYIHQDVYTQRIKSVVLDKFIDSKNHDNETIIYWGKNNKQEIMTFTGDFDGLYDFLNVGDSIIKEPHTLYYKVIFQKTGKDTLFKFYSSCKDSLIKSH